MDEERARERLPIERARSELVAALRELDGLTMIGIGESGGRPCLLVGVVAIDQATRAAVPASYGGWPIELRESERPHALR